MNTSSDNTVVELDIRESSIEDAADQAYQVVRDFRWRRGSVRVVVIDDALSIADHESIYQAIQANQNTNLLCVAVGGPASRADGVALRTTQLLNNQTTATLWVGDPDGVSWPTEAMPIHGAPTLRTPPETLRELREILRMHEVFDDVIRIASDLPYRVASPGHLVAAGQVGPVQLAAAQLASVEQVAGGGGERPHGGDVPAVDYWPLITTEPAPTDAGSAATRLRTGSPLDTCRKEADQLLSTARADVLAVGGRLGPRLFARPSPVLDNAAQAGGRLAEFHRAARDLFGRIDGLEGLSSAARERLTHAGVDMRELAGAGHREIATRLRDALVARFRDGMSLRENAELSRRLSEHATISGSRARQADLDAACPTDLLDRLVDPPPLPWRLLRPWVLVVVVVCCLLAALGPFGPVAGIVVGLGWFGVVFAGTTRRPVRGDRWLRFEPGLLAQLGAAAIGVGTGLGIADDVTVPVQVGWAALAVAIVGLAVTLRHWWSRAIAAWGIDELLAAGQAANSALLARLSDVAVSEWVANGPRRFVASGSYEIAIALEAVVDALDQWLPATRPGALVGARTSATDELQHLITVDIRHVVGKVLDGSWRALEAGAFPDIAQGVKERTLELLDDYSLHLENVGIDEPFQPDPDAAPASRTKLVRTLWQQSTEINWLMYEAGADSSMVQLCGPEDVTLLDGTRENFRLIRFAPRAARESVTAARPIRHPDADITWTGAGHIAGVLRLVPLRSNAVESDWSATAQETDVYR